MIKRLGPGSPPPALNLAPRASEIARVDPWWSGIAAENFVPGEVAEELRVCLHELLGNVVMHGGPGVSLMVVRAAGELERMSLTVEDNGPPFDPTRQPAPPVPDQLDAAPVGGLGLVLVRRFADDFGYQRVGCRNCVTVRRFFAPRSNATLDSGRGRK